MVIVVMMVAVATAALAATVKSALLTAVSLPFCTAITNRKRQNVALLASLCGD